MSLGWDSLPLLPLRCILDHLSMEDALAAMSTCRHWRSAVLLYEGKKQTLKLSTGHLEKNMFLTKLFRKNTRNLHIYIETERDLQKFINFILPQFFNSTKLKELMFIRPSYVHQSPIKSVMQLKRIITESLVFKHSHCIENLMYLGCEMSISFNEYDKYTDKLVEYYSKALSYSRMHSSINNMFSKCNNNDILVFSTLKHILLDYEQVNTEMLETLANLSNFTQLSLNIIYKRQMNLTPIDWLHLTDFYPNGLDVAVNIISLPRGKFKDVINNVLVERLQLTSLKVMFCKYFDKDMVMHVASLYSNSLRELVWVDSPYEGFQRFIYQKRHEGFPYEMNAFIFLCWQCVYLQRIVIHGYWIWLYEMEGFVSLSKNIRDLEVSAIYQDQEKFSLIKRCTDSAIRVLATDAPEPLNAEFQQRLNIGSVWKRKTWGRCHPALRARCTPQQRMDYVVYETSHPLNVT